ncbi:tRNA wybutosine-synthesizing protein [Cordyceps militaris CM01]|uniref:tRNA(Phe) 7-[(3-amino-3-carboxypropyl)-4-demethylwyosine(37)-N(4)]-methyltransferase n=1 Tax=Cordyceps militaris (strain CM01) TaxID=983644 RepID=G3J7D4_CORMM|nr:tRNA wybutosine-synthesizing protein [Cordyceps militaris CM01]EGX96304.1 tRNA wybutosine-synthesizing protein [Cordyceps militaris CM01]
MVAPSPLPFPGPTFEARKSKILEQLAVPDAEYSDASPKGTVDVGIRPLLAKINASAGFVTTSSCAGRVSVFVEGRKTADAGAGAAVDAPEPSTVAGLGGKGGGGTWLYVSHDPHPLVGQGVVVDWVEELGLSGAHDDAALSDATGGGGSERRLIHFKFEPMILHVLTASHAHAQLLLRCALHAGFRESGAVSLVSGEQQSAQPMVAVRSMGLGFESLLGYADDDEGGRRRLRLLVPPGYLDTLMAVGHARFAENVKRIRRFEEAFAEATAPSRNLEGRAWEDAAARRERMRAEGLRRQAAAAAEQADRTEAEPDVGQAGISL